MLRQPLICIIIKKVWITCAFVFIKLNLVDQLCDNMCKLKDIT